MAQTKNQSWAKRAERVFSDIERAEGERLFTGDAVALVSATTSKIVVHVMAEGADEVVIEETRGGVSAECICPIWEQGIPCRHMWAAILAADLHLGAKPVSARRPRIPAGTPTPDLQDAAPAAVAPWRSLLFPTAFTTRPKEHPGGVEYYISYELRVANNAILFCAFKYRLLKSGKLGKPAKIGKDMLRNQSLALQDHAILGFILGARLNEVFLRHGYLYDTYGLDFENYRPDSTALSYLLPKLVATGRCSLVLENTIQAHALRPGGVGRLEWSGEGEGARTYEARIRLDTRDISLQDVFLFFNTTPVMFAHEGLLHSLPDVSYDWITAMRRRKGKVRVPKGEMRDLVLAVLDEPSAPAIDIPVELMPTTRVDVTITPCLELTMDKAGVWSRMWFDYGGLEVAYDDPRPQMLDVDSWTRIERDRLREADLLEDVRDLDLDPVGAAPLDPANLWSRLDQLTDRGWIMRGRDKRRICGGSMGALRVSSGMDWFDLEGEVDFGDVVVPLTVAVRAYLRGETLIDLGNGETGLLPQDWLAQHARLLDMGDTGRAKDGALHFHSAHAQLLDELLEQCPDQPRDFLELRQKFKTFAGVTPPEPPTGFTGSLRPYQREALGWFDFLASFGFGGILADDMGLGKTIQALAWMVLARSAASRGRIWS